MKICVVDDSVAIRMGIPVMLDSVDVVGSYSSVEALLAENPEADVVLLDLRLSTPTEGHRLQGDEAIRLVADRGYPVCIYTDERRLLVLAQCLQAGAKGVGHKSDRPKRCWTR